MKNVRSASSLFQVAGCLFILTVVSAWQPDTTQILRHKSNPSISRDTTVPNAADVNEINLQLNLDSVMQQLNIAMSKIDYAKMNADVQKAMAQIDYNKINKDITAAMKNIDWNQMKIDVSRSLDSAKMAIDKINWDEMKAEVAKAQIEAKKAMAIQKINMDSVQVQVQQSLKEAQKSMLAAKAEFAGYKDLKTELEKDGFIQAGKPYSIQLKDGILYLNGVKQTKAITDKYSRFYSGKKNFTLKADGGTDL